MTSPNILMNPVTPALDKKDLVQHHLILLLHAMKCARRINSHECQLPLCSTMKQVLVHIQDCRNEHDCQYTHCLSSRSILDHYQTCKKDDCPICKDIRRERQKEVSPPIISCHSIGPSKPWHNEWQSSDHVRAYVVSKVEKDLQVFFPHSVRQMAERIERESYETAQSKEGYFLAIAQRVFAASRQKRASMVKNKWKRLRIKKVGHKSERRSATFECVICLEDFRHSRRRKEKLKCNHVFHTTCIKKWLNRSPACPLCRAPKG